MHPAHIRLARPLTLWGRGCLAAIALFLGCCSEAPVKAPAAADTASAEVEGDAHADAVQSDVAADIGAPDPDAGVDVGGTARQPCDSAATCPPGDDSCLKPHCHPTHGCMFALLADGAACEDDDVCTVQDHCKDGGCEAGPNLGCGCKADVDCAPADDGDKCNGTMYCDKSVGDGVCKVNPATVVSCPPVEAACQVAACEPTSGACVTAASPDHLPCDDGQICTVGDSCQAGNCKPGTDICSCKSDADCPDDADLCNGKRFCDKSGPAWQCATNPATIVLCPASVDPCMVEACKPATGKCSAVAAADGGPCSDDTACTKGDVCKGGACQPGPDVCSCGGDADCKALEDGDLCNGTLFCKKSLDSGTCVVNPATVVYCPTGLDGPCAKTFCQPKQGNCALVPTQEGLGCDDGNPCSGGDSCKAGVCAATTTTCKCQSDADCKDDGDLCNGTMFCNKQGATWTCAVNPATQVTCTDDDDPCTLPHCDAKTGSCQQKPAAPSTLCQDGNPCSAGDTCKDGVCVAGTNVCICQSDADCKGKEDGNPCNGTLYCDKSKGSTCQVNPNTLVTCSQVGSGPCLTIACDPGDGKCKPLTIKELEPCNADDNPCTVGDVCKKGNCAPGTNVCQCIQDDECKSKEDGNPCNGTLFCDKSEQPFRCRVNPATVITCPDAVLGSCEAQACAIATGKCGVVPQPDSLPCSDGNACTVGDSCTKGVCKGGTNVCGCLSTADCAEQDDDNACNGKLYCDKAALPWACKVNPATLVSCDPKLGSACLGNLCDPKSGFCKLSAINPGKGCDDGNACSQNDACEGGACLGILGDCNDGNACTADSCDPKTGCVHIPKPLVLCDDGNACTADACDAKLACVHTVQNGKACFDGDVCSVEEVCVSGVCKGKPDACEDGSTCTIGECDPKVGCKQTVADGICGPGGTLRCLDGACGGCAAFQLALSDAKDDLRGRAVIDDGGGALIAGYAQQAGGGVEGWLQAVDAGGAAAWSKRIAGPNGDGRFEALTRLADGRLVLGGASVAQLQERPWQLVAKADGTVVDSQVLAGPAGELRAMLPLSDGGWLATGWQLGGGVGESDAIVLRYDAKGQQLMAKRYGEQAKGETARSERIFGLGVGLQGGVLAVGEATAAAGVVQAYALHIDLQGQVLFETRVGAAISSLRAVRGLADGGARAVGLHKASASAPGDALAVHLSAAGTATTATQQLGGDDAWVVIRALPDGGELRVGTTAATGLADAGNGVVERLDSKGNRVFLRHLHGLGDDALVGGGAFGIDGARLVGQTRVNSATPIAGWLLHIDGEGNDFCPCRLGGPDLDEGLHDQVFKGGAATLDRGAVAVGWTLPGGAFASSALVLRLDRDLQPTWQKVIEGSGARALHDVARTGQDVYTAVGELAAGDDPGQGWVLRIDGAGTVIGEQVLGVAGLDGLRATAGVRDAKGHPTGAIVAAGVRGQGSQGVADGWLLRLEADGTIGFSAELGTAFADHFEQVQIAETPGGGNVGGDIVAAGLRGKSSTVKELWAARLTAAGKVSWQVGLSADPAQSLSGLLVLANGSAIVAGAVKPTYVSLSSHLARLDVAGQVLPTAGYNYSGATPDELTAIAAAAGGGWIAAVGFGIGSVSPYFTNYELAKWPADGGTPTAPNLSPALKGRVDDLVEVGDGSLIALGTVRDTGGHLGLFARRLHSAKVQQNCPSLTCGDVGCTPTAGCAARLGASPCDHSSQCTLAARCVAGTCTTTETLVCSATSACTTTSCGAATGCLAVAGKNGAVCGNSQTCNAGSCGPCTRYEAALAPSGVRLGARGVALLDGNKAMAAGWSYVGSSGRAFVALLDIKAGTLDAHVPTVSGLGFDAHYDLARRGSEVMVVGAAGATSADGNNRARALRVDLAGKVLSDHFPPELDRRLFSVATLPGDAGWLAVGDNGSDGAATPIDLSGKLGVPVKVSSSGGSGLQAVAVGASQTLAVGDLVPHDWMQRRAAVWRWNAGALELHWLDPTPGALLRALTFAPDGRTFAAGERQAGGKLRGAIVALDAGGKLLWTHVDLNGRDSRFYGIAVHPAAGIGVAGFGTSPDDVRLFGRIGLDGQGAILRGYVTSVDDTFRPIRALDDAWLLAGTWGVSSSAHKLSLVRVGLLDGSPFCGP